MLLAFLVPLEAVSLNKNEREGEGKTRKWVRCICGRETLFQ